MEVLTPITTIQVPNDDYQVTVRFNEADLEEAGLIYLNGTSTRIRIDLIIADYIQVLDTAKIGERHHLDADHPAVIYCVEKSDLINNLAVVTQGVMAEPGPEAYEEYSHHRIILEKLVIDVVRRAYEKELAPIFLVEEVCDGESD